MDNNSQIQAKILIVDDSPTNLELLFHCLTSYGFQTLAAKSGIIALELVKKSLPDLILLDVVMPEMDGYEVCRQIKSNDETKDIPVIFLTSLSKTDEIVKGFDSGAVDYITKPFQRNEIIARINTHLTLRRQREQLEKLNKTKEKFFSIVAHDVGDVFVDMLSFFQVLSRSVNKLSKEQLEEFTHEMCVSAENTYKRLENLLNWAKIQIGSIKYKPKIIDLYEDIPDYIRQLVSEADKKEIKIINEVKAQTLVLADPKMLDTIFRNLFSNAVKFTKNGGNITISSNNLDDEFVEVLISDSGIGISEKKLSNLLKIEQTTNESGTSGERGSGLGLILCKEFIQKNGGNLEIHSKLNVGTTIKMKIKRALFT